MKEKLIIKDFGPIKSVELELGKINVLIGDQGTGKSTVAKLLISIQSTFFRDLFDVPEDEVLNRETQLFFEYLKIVGLQNYFNPNSEITYYTEVYSFELKEVRVQIQKFREPTLEENLSYDINYILAERLLVPTLANSLYALIEIRTALPKLFLRFGNKFQRAINEQSIFDYTNILKVKYSHRDNRDVIILSSGIEIPFDDASSGIQSSLILLIVFDSIINHNSKSFLNKNLDKILNYLIVEEPELDCFPETQYKIIKYLIKENTIVNNHGNVGYKNQLLITTHSPYVLTSINNMMYAYNVGQNHDEVNSIIEKKYWLNPDDVSVYMMLTDGTCEDIFDREEGLIMAEKIDGITNILNEQFSEMLNLEFAQNELDTK